MRVGLELVAAVIFVVFGSLAALWGGFLLGGEENAPQVGTWVLTLAAILFLLAIALVADVVRLRRSRRDGT